MARVQVQFLAYLSRAVGARQVEVDLPAPARVADLAERLQALYPAQSALLARAAFMQDGKNAPPETELADGAQVLALLLLSGGSGGDICSRRPAVSRRPV